MNSRQRPGRSSRSWTAIMTADWTGTSCVFPRQAAASCPHQMGEAAGGTRAAARRHRLADRVPQSHANDIFTPAEGLMMRISCLVAAGAVTLAVGIAARSEAAQRLPAGLPA